MNKVSKNQKRCPNNKILIVDDDKSILETMSKALRKVCNFRGEIKTVKSGEDAVEEISNCFYNICFLDIKLPDLNGLDVMRRIKELSPETKIAIMTGSLISDDMKRTIEEGASLFIEKPFDISQIKPFVKQVPDCRPDKSGQVRQVGENY